MFSRKKYHRKTSTLLSIIAFLFLHSLFCVNTFNADEIFESIDSSLGEITVFFSDEKQKDSINISEIEIEEVPETIDSYSSLIGLNIENSTSETEIDKLVLEFKNIIDPSTVCKVYQLKENVLNPVNSKFSNNSIQLNNIEPGLIFVVFSYENEKTEKSGQFSRSILIDGIEIYVNADAGVFPEDAELAVEKIDLSENKEITDALDSERKENKKVAVSYTYDIKIINADGEEIQPQDESKVEIAFRMAEANNSNLSADVYHIEESETGELSAELLDTSIEGDTVYVETDSFSYYTVEFFYNDLEYVMEGETTVPLSDILEYLGIEGIVESVEVSNTELINVELTDEKWVVTSLQAFESKEWMKVGIDGIEYKIVLTDSFFMGWPIDGVYAWLDSRSDGTYKLVIRPSSGNGGDTGEGHIYTSKTSEADWPWHNYRNQISEVEFRGTVRVEEYTQINDMFANMTRLTKVNFKSTTGEGFVTEYASSIARMFQGCTSLVSIDMSHLTSDGRLWDMSSLFKNCSSLEEVILANKNFVTRGSMPGGGGINMANMFAGCDELKTVDFSGSSFGGRSKDGSEWRQFNNLFKGLTKLETVRLKNTKVPGMRDFSSMFEGCTSLTTVELKDFVPSDAEKMTNMFKGCSSLKELDVSSFGVLRSIQNMDGFIEGCTSLESINMDKLDNSNIGPHSEHHSIDELSHEASMITGASEYGREIFGKDVYFPNLKTISARNSNIWMAKNNRGKAGSEYYISANENDVLWFTRNKTTFESDLGPTVEISTKRDYVDLITDRDNKDDNKHRIVGYDGNLPDLETNINIKNDDLNRNGSGHLPAGVYTISDVPWDEPGIRINDTVYQLSYIGDEGFGIDRIVFRYDSDNDVEVYSYDDLVIVKSDNFYWINTKEKYIEEWTSQNDNHDYVIDRSDDPIVIRYMKAAVDKDGNRYDVLVKIKKITFKDTDKVPLSSGRNHDDNYYADDNPYWNNYYRTVLQVSKDDITFRNYARAGHGNFVPGVSEDYQILSGGSGTDIEFEIVIDGATDGDFVFYGYDLDVAQSQDWIRDNYDACFDNLPITESNYGIGGESFELGKGVDAGSVNFASHTGLVQVGNEIISTGSDPSTSWSGFTVNADAKGAAFIWKSGVACSTYALKKTEPIATIRFPIIKEIEGRDFGKNDKFKFTIGDKDNLFDEESKDDFVIDYSDQKEIEDGKYEYKRNLEGSVALSDLVNNRKEFVFTVKEKEGNINDLDYDSETYTITAIVTYNPEEYRFIVKYKSDGHEITDLTVKNKLKKGSLIVEKKTKDNKAGVFEFEATFWTERVEESQTLRRPYTISQDKLPEGVTPKGNGIYWFDLEVKADQQESTKMIFDELPYGVHYSICEKNKDGWTLTSINDVSKAEKSEGIIGQDGKAKISTVFINELNKYDLEIKKVVEGNMGDKSKEFRFEITIPDLAGTVIKHKTGLYACTLDSSGYCSFTLTHDQSVLIESVYYGTEYSVSESDYSDDGYNTTVDTVSGRSIAGTLADDTVHVFKNTYNTAIPTEVRLRNGLSGWFLLTPAALFILIKAFKRKDDE